VELLVEASTTFSPWYRPLVIWVVLVPTTPVVTVTVCCFPSTEVVTVLVPPRVVTALDDT